jgi:hypothetical protein
MEYVKPTLVLAGTTQALVLGIFPGNDDSNPPTLANTKPTPMSLGLDD